MPENAPEYSIADDYDPDGDMAALSMRPRKLSESEQEN
jgi:hypothetical protein